MKFPYEFIIQGDNMAYGSVNVASGTRQSDLDKKYDKTGGTISGNVVIQGSVAEGSGVANGRSSHAEGEETKATGNVSHVEGYGSVAGGKSHSEGYSCIAFGSGSHTEGFRCIAVYNDNLLRISSFDVDTKTITFDTTYGEFSRAFSKLKSNVLICIMRRGLWDTPIIYTIESIDKNNNSVIVKENITISYIGDEITAILDDDWVYAIHAEGYNTIASGRSSHAEGESTIANGTNSHAEGYNTIANGSSSHAEGEENTISKHNRTSHVEGYGNIIIYPNRDNYGEYGEANHVEGSGNIANGSCCHVEGMINIAAKDALENRLFFYKGTGKGNGKMELNCTVRNSDSQSTFNKFVIGMVVWIYTTDYNASIRCECIIESIDTTNKRITVSGDTIYISSNSSGMIVIKDNLTATINAHVEGTENIASGFNSHAEGTGSYALTSCSHAEGNITTASGSGSHAEGYNTKAEGNYSHAEGSGTTASAFASHAEGDDTTASGNYSHAGGYNTKASGLYQTAIGAYNKESTVETDKFIIGNGTSNTARSNCLRVTNTNGVYSNSTYKSSGADYAEMFEWLDGNVKNENRKGLFVTLNGDKICIATSQDDYILGIVSACPSVCGDVNDDTWGNMYLTTIFGTPILEKVKIPERTDEIKTINENGEEITKTIVIEEAHTEIRQKLNPEYDNTQKYIPRSERPEWAAVGMLGKLVAIDDGSCEKNGWCTVGNGGVATKSEKRTKFRVMSRLDESHIKVLIL